jgi:DNA helicase-4
MINNSYDLLKNIEKDQIDLNYKYIIIDEYQDISIQRFNLTKEVSRLSDAKVIAVGDDWQAVFAFAGSDVTLFTEFKKLMGYGEELQITNTYRNSQELIDIAGRFVMRNSKQIKKRLKAQKSLPKPVVIVNYDDNEEKTFSRAYAVDECIKNIVMEYGDKSSILLIGRYNFDKYHLLNSNLFYEYEQDKIKSLNFPNVKITFLTAHSSKGLGFDNVIIINGSEGIYGFPSQIQNDPIMDIIAVKDNSFKFAEERRLFYVALTRTKNKVYIITPNNNPSSFLTELKDYPNVEIVFGTKKNFGQREDLCPACNHPLIRKSFNSLNIRNLYECSNEKELCDFKTNNLILKKKIEVCSECKDGFLVIKQNAESKKYFLGCTNYKKDKSGCNNAKTIF